MGGGCGSSTLVAQGIHVVCDISIFLCVTLFLAVRECGDGDHLFMTIFLLLRMAG